MKNLLEKFRADLTRSVLDVIWATWSQVGASMQTIVSRLAAASLPTNESPVASDNRGSTLSVAIAYEDTLSREWTRQECERVTDVIGRDCLLIHAWKIADLTRPEVFPEAVRAASELDVIVISFRAAEEAPLDLCVWIDAWLPRCRRRETGLRGHQSRRGHQTYVVSYSRHATAGHGPAHLPKWIATLSRMSMPSPAPRVKPSVWVPAVTGKTGEV